MELKLVSSMHDNEVTKLLSDALKRARNGELNNVVLLAVDLSGNVDTSYAGDFYYRKMLVTGGLYSAISDINSS
jgi:hypothetical protein